MEVTTVGLDIAKRVFQPANRFADRRPASCRSGLKNPRVVQVRIRQDYFLLRL